MHASSEPNVETPENPNDTSISDAETQSGDEHEPDVDLDNPQSRNQRYDKRDFVAKKHGRERETWFQKPMPFPPKPSKKSALLK